MQIIGGNRRGLALSTPDGDSTRPTSARARESLFNILNGPRYRDRLIGRPAADFFAGSGAVGLEALSRGASQCCFLETDRAALEALKSNIAKMKSATITQVIQVSATAPPPTTTPVGFLFLDPPYEDVVSAQTVTRADAAGWIDADGLVVVQQHPKAAFTAPEGFYLADDRRYGAARFVFLERK